MNKYITYVALGMLILGTLGVPNAAADVVPISAPTPVMIAENAAYSDGGLYSEMNLTRLQVNPRYSDMQLKPGESDKITVTVTNKDNKTVTSVPAVVIPPYSEFIFERSWVTITPASADIEPDAKQEFTIEVNIPANADIGIYGAQIAFTEDVPTPYPTPYPKYINTMQLSVNVWTPPNIQIQTRYINDRVEAGTEYDYEIKLKNIADNDIAIDPKISENNRYMYDGPYGMMSPAFEADSITITAPNVVKAGETAVVSVHLTVPDGAKGRYSGAIDLNIDDPSIREWDGQVGMNFEVWTQPTTPYTKAFTARTGDPITIEVSSNQYDYGGWMGATTRSEKEPSFDLALEGPSGEVDLALIKTTYSGSVSLGMYDFPPWEMDSAGIYRDAGTRYVETYRAPGAAGEWTLGILPENTERFDYTITIGPSE